VSETKNMLFQLTVYTNIFQGLTPVTNLTVHCFVKTSTGLEVKIKSVDDGTGELFTYFQI